MAESCVRGTVLTPIIRMAAFMANTDREENTNLVISNDILHDANKLRNGHEMVRIARGSVWVQTLSGARYKTQALWFEA